jgi:chromosomal replication initiation ATPase DnaA
MMNFDFVFSESDNNKFVYDHSLSPSLANVVKGYNTTVLCYGMTGAGKTFTMFGSQQRDENPGLVYLSVKELFSKHFLSEKIAVKLSFLEIYNENVLFI